MTESAGAPTAFHLIALQPDGEMLVAVADMRIYDEITPALLQGLPSGLWTADRSEEHTSELQSLMRISYAVFCLKKKKKTTSTNGCNLNIYSILGHKQVTPHTAGRYNIINHTTNEQ